ncbi:hypothetical protein BJ170DRAFT_105060 [Xylariales sp. AK1849]|nr:hypothetical protein BJ170DRAFT_105060 [Xylariales sp. AK1849]
MTKPQASTGKQPPGAMETTRGGERQHIPGTAPTRSNKKGKKVKANPDNMNWVKKRARTLERRFRTGQNLPADTQNNLERELAHHKQKIEEADEDKKRKQMIQKYHMIRFFERKKADRLAKQIETQLKEMENQRNPDPAEKEKLERDLHTAQIDSLYAKFFPYRERYVSIYAAKDLGLSVQGEQQPETASTASRALKAERPPLWSQVEKLSKNGVPALIKFRERKLGIDSRSKAPPERVSKHSFAAKAEALKAKSPLASAKPTGTTKPGAGRMDLRNPTSGKRRRDDSPSGGDGDSDSDGGFFEEE